MNKIMVNTSNYNLDVIDDSIIIINKDTNLNIKINDNKNGKIILLIKKSLVNINLDMFSNCSLVINNLGIDSSINYNVNIDSNSNLKVVDSILSKINSINNINIYHKGENINTKFWTNGINLKNNKLYFNINGNIDRNSINSYLEENSKAINIEDGDSKIIPNLIIDTKEVIANHSAFIGNFSQDDLYYLMSRGINERDAKILLIKSILLSNMESPYEEFIKEIYEYLNWG